MDADGEGGGGRNGWGTSTQRGKESKMHTHHFYNFMKGIGLPLSSSKWPHTPKVLSKLEELVQVAEGGESREVSVVSRGKEGERQGRRKILKPLQSARKRVKGALAVALQRGEPEESTHDPPPIDAAQH